MPLPAANGADAGLPTMRFLLAETVVAFDHVRRTMTVTGERRAVDRGDRRARRAAGRAGGRAARAGRGRGGDDRGRLRRRRRAGQGAHRRGRRLPDRPLPARPPPDRRLAGGDLPGAPGRQPVAVHVPARHGGLPAHRLVARDARPARARRHLRAAPDRRDAPARRDARPRTTPWPPSSSRARRTGPSTRCSSTWPETTWAGSASRGRCASSGSWTSSATRTSCTSSRGSSAQIADGHDAPALLRATFPAGTVSGAPKVRAMQIISELEGRRRGAYAGAVGWLGFGGDMDTCIAIRTVVLRDGVAYLQSGGGIVVGLRPRRRVPRGDEQGGRARRRHRPGRVGGVRAMSARVLVIDNYDSFTYNLVDYIATAGAEVRVERNDAVTAEEAEAWAPTPRRRLARAGDAARGGRVRGGRPPHGRPHPDPRRVPRPPGHLRALRRPGRPGRADRPRQARRGDARRLRRSTPACRARSRPAATTRWRRSPRSPTSWW